MYRVSFENEAGELDARNVATEEDAKQAALEMLEAAPYLQAGDRIIVREIP